MAGLATYVSVVLDGKQILKITDRLPKTDLFAASARTWLRLALTLSGSTNANSRQRLVAAQRNEGLLGRHDRAANWERDFRQVPHTRSSWTCRCFHDERHTRDDRRWKTPHLFRAKAARSFVSEPHAPFQKWSTGGPGLASESAVKSAQATAFTIMSPTASSGYAPLMLGLPDPSRRGIIALLRNSMSPHLSIRSTVSRIASFQKTQISFLTSYGSILEDVRR